MNAMTNIMPYPSFGAFEINVPSVNDVINTEGIKSQVKSLIKRAERVFYTADEAHASSRDNGATTLDEIDLFHQTIQRIQRSGVYKPGVGTKAPQGYFGGRAIMGGFSAVHGGIYVSPTPAEALVVDEKHGSLERIYNQLVMNFVRRKGDRKEFEKEILNDIVELVRKTIRYDIDAVKAIIKKEGLKIDQKTALDLFISEGKGASRHQLLLAAYLVEKLIQRNLLKGTIYLDLFCSFQKAIYTSPDGTCYVIGRA